VERAVNYLRDVGRLWAGSPRGQKREFVREVFARIVVAGRELVSITPKPLYAPLFVLDRRKRFGGDFCRMAPRAGIEDSLPHNPRTGEPLGVPALVLPDERDPTPVLQWTLSTLSAWR